jgi:hypothetical protein
MKIDYKFHYDKESISTLSSAYEQTVCKLAGDSVTTNKYIMSSAVRLKISTHPSAWSLLQKLC